MKSILILLHCIILISLQSCKPQTDKEYLEDIKNKDFCLIAREDLEEAHKMFELKALDLKTGKEIEFGEIFISYSIFTSICGSKPFIQKGDTLVKKKGEIIYSLYKKNCKCTLVLKDTLDNVGVDYAKSQGCN